MLIALWLVIAQLFGAPSWSHTTTAGVSAREYVASTAAAVAPLARIAVPRGDAPRSLPPTAATTPRRLSIGAASAAGARVRAFVSPHVVAAHETLLAYYPTAPPLQG